MDGSVCRYAKVCCDVHGVTHESFLLRMRTCIPVIVRFEINRIMFCIPKMQTDKMRELKCLLSKNAKPTKSKTENAGQKDPGKNEESTKGACKRQGIILRKQTK